MEKNVQQRRYLWGDTCLGSRSDSSPCTSPPPGRPHASNMLIRAEEVSEQELPLPEFHPSPHPMRIITHETTASVFAQAAFSPFLFSQRAPSGALALRLAFSSDLMGGFSPQKEKALIGARFSGGPPYFIAKFSWRKNLVSGCIVRRPSSSPWQVPGRLLSAR